MMSLESIAKETIEREIKERLVQVGLNPTEEAVTIATASMIKMINAIEEASKTASSIEDLKEKIRFESNRHLIVIDCDLKHLYFQSSFDDWEKIDRFISIYKNEINETMLNI